MTEGGVKPFGALRKIAALWSPPHFAEQEVIFMSDIKTCVSLCRSQDTMKEGSYVSL